MRMIIRFGAIFLSIAMLMPTTSCASMKPLEHDQGKHKGWNKNPKNPHHPDSTKEKEKAKKNPKK